MTAPADRPARRRLEIRAVVVGWRDGMSDIRSGWIPDSRESIHALSIRALALLDNIERSYQGQDDDVLGSLEGLMSDARAEVQGAILHDLADSGEVAG